MKFYLSSYKIGNETEKLVKLVGNKTLGFIPNALDYVEEGPKVESEKKNIKMLTDLGISIEMLDLKDYFSKKYELKKKLSSLGGVWVRGGNTFILRQAMKLSGFDELIKEEKREDFLYGGYSAGICVLAPSLKGISKTDNPIPFYGNKEPVWEGLGLLDYLILPHYQSDHPESEDVEKDLEFCKKNKIKCKTLRDGEVIILD